MNKLFKMFLVALLASMGLLVADAAMAGGVNDAEDDISSETAQSGSSSSGDAVGGQVVGVVSAGDASVDSTNRSEDVDVESGEAVGENDLDQQVGQEVGSGNAENELEGEISSSVAQDASATSGDGVGGAVIGVVTSAGGSADVVAANTSEDVDIETGDAFAENDDDQFVGQLTGNGNPVNFADDDISSEVGQTASSATGDGVGGQVIGIVSAGDASVDATNRSEDVDIETGSADAQNDIGGDQFVGQETGNGNPENELEDAEISSEVAQDASASSGDGVGGSVIGVVTSAGGSADVVAANTSEDVDIETGDAEANNFLDAFVGQLTGNGNPENDAEDDISFEAAQTVSAATGDGVGGQVLGIVSAGDASVDATNESTDVDVSTGDAYAENDAEYEVGQETGNGNTANFSDGEISSELAQDASANSGDAVGGQVAGVVTSAGGSADLVLANTSEDVDGESGFSEFVNESEEFVGQQISGGDD